MTRRIRGFAQRQAAYLGAFAAALAGTTGCRQRPILITQPPAISVDTLDATRAHPRPRYEYRSFWRAINDVNTNAAIIIADNSDQQRYARALAEMLDGNSALADSLTLALRNDATDTTVQRAAQITYGALLSARSDWRALEKLNARAKTSDDASFQAWAAAFAPVTTRAGFRDSVTTLPLTRTRSGAPVITVEINGVRKQLWLDTGSSITIIASPVARACDVTPLNSDTLELQTSIGRLRARPASIRTLAIGPLILRDAPSMIVSSDALTLRSGEQFHEQQTTIDGIIGFDTIRQLDITLDDVRGTVTIRRPVPRPNDPRHPRNLFWFGIPIVTAIADRGTIMHLSFDTGAEETYVTAAFLGKTGTRTRAAERRTLHGFGGRLLERGYVIPDVRLTIGETPLRLQRIFLYEAQYPTLFELDGTLGADVGRGAVMRIDMTNGRLDITR